MCPWRRCLAHCSRQPKSIWTMSRCWVFNFESSWSISRVRQAWCLLLRSKNLGKLVDWNNDMATASAERINELVARDSGDPGERAVAGLKVMDDRIAEKVSALQISNPPIVGHGAVKHFRGNSRGFVESIQPAKIDLKANWAAVCARCSLTVSASGGRSMRMTMSHVALAVAGQVVWRALEPRRVRLQNGVACRAIGQDLAGHRSLLVRRAVPREQPDSHDDRPHGDEEHSGR